MELRDARDLETDPRFPSGRWTGFFMQHVLTGRQTMTLDLTFQGGRLEARGRDVVGPFNFRGTYDTQDGRCRWTKHYDWKHNVAYTGVNEGQGIWGVWEIRLLWGLYLDRGVFHIWPEGQPPSAEADLTELAHQASPGPRNVVVGLIAVALLVAAYVTLRLAGFDWLVRLFQ